VDCLHGDLAGREQQFPDATGVADDRLDSFCKIEIKGSWPKHVFFSQSTRQRERAHSPNVSMKIESQQHFTMKQQYRSHYLEHRL
jgi:hypothetical protein